MADKSGNSKSLSIGIDVGGTKTQLALFSEKLEVLDDIKIKTPKEKEAFQDELTKVVRKFSKGAKEEGQKVSAIGIGFAGSIDQERAAIENALQIPDLADFSFSDALQDGV